MPSVSPEKVTSTLSGRLGAVIVKSIVGDTNWPPAGKATALTFDFEPPPHPSAAKLPNIHPSSILVRIFLFSCSIAFLGDGSWFRNRGRIGRRPRCRPAQTLS